LAERKETRKAASNSILPLTARLHIFRSSGHLAVFNFLSFYNHLTGIKSSMDGPKEGVSASSRGLVGAIHIADGFTVDLTDKVHQLPCCIKYNGQCCVSDYFKPKITGVVVDELELKEASFRGKRLAGTTLPIPESYCGFVLEKKNSKREMVSSKGSTSEKGGLDTWNATASFQNITYWNHDTIPSESDTFNCCFHWFAVADAIHKPITAAEVASETCEIGTKNGAACGQKRKSNKRC
jgi:ribonuclease H2 subunit C